MKTIGVMCRDTGRMVDGIDSLRQRLTDCLSFSKGSLVGARDYGAGLLDLLDRNITPSFSMDVFVVVTEAINEPVNGLGDFRLDGVGISEVGENHVELSITGIWVPNNEVVTLEGVRIGGR